MAFVKKVFHALACQKKYRIFFKLDLFKKKHSIKSVLMVKMDNMFDKLKSIGQSLRKEIRVYQTLMKDRRTPRTAKILLWLAVGYTLLPFDIIPDFIPVIGHLDDFIIVPLLVVIALKMIPQEVIDLNRYLVAHSS